jgi:hypothetical protein
MVITDKFVYIHMPKTGGTFVTSVLERLHELPDPSLIRSDSVRSFLTSLLRRLQAGAMNSESIYGQITNMEPKHGTCHDIPEQHRDKPVLSNMRNPYDWYVSQFEFSWWKRTFMYHPEEYPTPAGFAIEQVLPEFEREHPHFPNISFSEFVNLCYQAANFFNDKHGTDFGLYTHSFVRFNFRVAMEVIARIDRDYICSGRYSLDMFDVHFIKTCCLNQELYDFLKLMGYRVEDLEFILELGKIFPDGRGRRDDQNWERYYTPSLKEFVREKEWILFEMFPDFDV